MGNNEVAKSTTPDKSTLPAPPVHNGMHTYPPTDWAAMQAFYGPGIPPPQYYSSAYPAGRPPLHPYMWGPPQAMMPPFAAPYAAIYSQGGVFAHPGFPVGSPKPVLTPLSTPFATKTLAATALTIQTPGNLSGHTTGGCATSESGENGGLSDRSGEKTDEAGQSNRKRKCEGSDLEKTAKLEIQDNSLGPDVNGNLEKASALEMKSGHTVNSKATFDAQHRGSKSSPEICLQNERQLKQERRKQSNRESARRSRLRKQAESEELADKVDVLMSENTTLKSEITQLVQNSEKLKLENINMMGKLKMFKLEKKDKLGPNNVEEKRNPPLSTENLLSRVNNTGPVPLPTQEDEGEMYSNKNTNTAKLRQLLDASPRSDAVAAS